MQICNFMVLDWHGLLYIYYNWAANPMEIVAASWNISSIDEDALRVSIVVILVKLVRDLSVGSIPHLPWGRWRGSGGVTIGRGGYYMAKVALLKSESARRAVRGESKFWEILQCILRGYECSNVSFSLYFAPIHTTHATSYTTILIMQPSVLRMQ